MPSRGSGIGASMFGGLGTGLVGGSSTSARPAAPGSAYGPKFGGQNVDVHHMLWVLVLLEIAALIGLRHAFRHYHGG